ncbi:hypothetical protein I3F58_02165 [Streptomyces sp. MUM 203J]|uniref:hypothetical protein n=1 Tax=Streptomyces sp. MUM 203J TaxID=2791990 RepID=UPI001F050289|nr:hypothetical protein [Streptomyces sp. MUM 203J]MCH0538384.1 hypothetical protein [Streptomyces sp. MUM 203J]
MHTSVAPFALHTGEDREGGPGGFRGFTERGRSLRTQYLGDGYRLTAVDGRSHRLTHEPDSEDPGVVVTVKPSGPGAVGCP